MTTSNTFTRLPRGIHPIIYALFDAEGQLDRAAMRRQIEICLEQGAKGIVTLGLATEVRFLTDAQRRQVVEWNVEDIAGRVPLGVTIYADSADEQLADIEHSRDAGASWVVIQPLADIRTEEALVAHFSYVLEKSALPAAVQNVPQFLGVGLSVGAITALAERFANFIAIKQEVSATELAALAAQVGDRIQVFSGRGGIDLIDCHRAGADGQIPAPEYADLLFSIWDDMEAGNEKAARATYARSLPLATFILQSVDALTLYGKMLFCLRHGLPFHIRPGSLEPTKFGVEALAGHAKFNGLELDADGLAAVVKTCKA